jgi:rare lipoprotein A
VRLTGVCFVRRGVRHGALRRCARKVFRARPATRLWAILLTLILLGGALPLLSGCGGGNGEKLGERVIPLGQPVPKGGGRYSVGKPYQVAGGWYTPREDPSYDEVGRASWYGELFHGRYTANGEIYDMDRLTAAHPTLPLPVYARVTNLANGRNIVVRINDRGPFARDRIIDLSRRSADALGFRKNGTAQVRVTYLGKAPLNGDDSYERRYLASQGSAQFATARRIRPTADPVAVASIPSVGTPPRKNTDKLASRLAPPQANPKQARFAPAMQPTPAGARLVQAGTFKSQENAERARTQLASIAPVDVAPIKLGGDTFFRVRIGPFAADAEAASALARVRQEGYTGARIVRK